MSATELECSSIDDCTVEVDGRTIVKFCYASMVGTNRTNFCDCSNWVGYTGEHCDQVSLQVVYTRVVQPVTMIWCLLIAANFSYQSFKFYSISRKWNLTTLYKRQTMRNVFRSLFICVLLMFSALFVFGYSFFVAKASFDPTFFSVATFKTLLGDEKTSFDIQPRFESLNTIFLALGFTLLFAASLQVSLSWIEVLQKTRRMFGDDVVHKFIDRFKAGALIASLVFLLMTIIFVSISNFSAYGYLNGVATTILLLLFVAGRTRFVILTRQLSEQAKKEASKAIRLVEITTLCHVICLFVIVVLLLAYGFLSSGKVFTLKPGSFNYVEFCIDLSVLAGLTLMTVDAWYMRSVCEGFSSKTNNPSKTMTQNQTSVTQFSKPGI